MDLQNLISLVAALIAVISAGIAALFGWWQTRRMDQSLEVVTYNGATDLTLQIDRIFIEYPELRPYFYEGQSPIDQDETLRQRVDAVSEFALDALECIWDHREKYTEMDRESWKIWINEFMASSPRMRGLYEDHTTWYPALEDARKPDPPR
ncbi:hypothetical protein ACWEQV_29080 [Rhodococcus aetherivorans]|uniref:hypothetical protein n=1 Tax=Rhodococcus aetherivorans TaxID=191292 RepID=UPI002949159B|nr:hypothetical protein [Rhodococcus aetherivorans]MDV6297466.1 hypothetical protein [Rhodococcus aetherivorans]